MSRVRLWCRSNFFLKVFKKSCLFSFVGGVAVGKLNVWMSWMRFFVVENIFSFPYCFRSSLWYLLTLLGSLDLTLLAVSEGVEVGICFPRKEKLSTSIHSILWPSDGADGLPPSKGVKPALVMSILGVTQMASIGVREVFLSYVAGGDCDGCDVSIAFCSWLACRIFERVHVRTSAFISIPMMRLSPICFQFCISVSRSLSNCRIGFGSCICFSFFMYL